MELFAKTTKSSVIYESKDKLSLQTSSSILPTISHIPINPSEIQSFKELGLCNWICNATAAMGYKRPTPIQSSCIPAIVSRRNVLGCAVTGSGKTAAFALPLLQHLSEDPFGIFAVILTPTRELAIQISEQVSAFGAAIDVRQALIIGGVSMTEQSIALSKLPHIIICTPGRLRHHLVSCDPPNLSRARYLVLDEADRLLATGFSAELNSISEAMCHPKRQTLFFSATLTTSLSEIDLLASIDTLRFDLTAEHKVPLKLIQQYVFVPPQVKLCYLVAILRNFFISVSNNNDDDNDALDGKSSAATATVKEMYEEAMSNANSNGKHRVMRQQNDRGVHSNKKRKLCKSSSSSSSSSFGLSSSSVIVFVSSCKKCAEISVLLEKLDIPCVALHSVLNQSKRSEALSSFKSRMAPVLVATDVAGRGLDIQSVDLVVNFDIPRIASDYIHRVGRTSRGTDKSGRAISLVTPHDMDLVAAVETLTTIKLQKSDEIDEEKDIVPILNEIAKAKKEAQLLLMEQGFDEKLQVFKERKIQQRKKSSQQITKK